MDRPSVRATGETTVFEDGTVRERHVAVFESAEAAGVDRVLEDTGP